MGTALDAARQGGSLHGFAALSNPYGADLSRKKGCDSEKHAITT